MTSSFFKVNIHKYSSLQGKKKQHPEQFWKKERVIHHKIMVTEEEIIYDYNFALNTQNNLNPHWENK